MSARSFIGASRALIVIASALALAVGLWAFWWQSGDVSSPGGRPRAAFYTVDDGATWFADAADQLTPFDRGGKQAVRAYVYSCGGGPAHVEYLERYTTEGKALSEKFRADQKAAPGTLPESFLKVDELGLGGLEVKKPGGEAWLNMRDPKALAITNAPCPGGAVRTPVKP